MADKLNKRNHQNQNAMDNDPEAKRQKQNKNEAEAVVRAANEPKSITNIYYDCLERIFDYLDFKRLFMVARTCKRLQLAAAAKFGDQYGGMRIQLWPKIGNGIYAWIYMHSETIDVDGLQFCLPFVRCFGAKISDLSINYNRADDQNEYLGQYISQYCADSLTSIEIRSKKEFHSKTFQKTFKNVGNVKISNCQLVGNELSNIVDWFPNLRRLEICACSVDENALLNVPFPNLEQLYMYIWPQVYGRLRIEHAVQLLQANPQLQSLVIWSNPSLALSTVLNAIEQNPNITELTMQNGSTMIDVSMDELNRFAVEHPLMVELILPEHRIKADDAINFIGQMKSLKCVGFRVTDHHEFDRLLRQLDSEWQSDVSRPWGELTFKLNR